MPLTKVRRKKKKKKKKEFNDISMVDYVPDPQLKMLSEILAIQVLVMMLFVNMLLTRMSFRR